MRRGYSMLEKLCAEVSVTRQCKILGIIKNFLGYPDYKV
jgi:hypothetical protein